MNFSHGTYEYHQSVIDNTRKMLSGMVIPSFFHCTTHNKIIYHAADPSGRPVAIALDTVRASSILLLFLNF
jgi:pyruvate kinase